jgi:hypothetical protein
MTTWFKPDSEEGGYTFLSRNDWIDHEGMVEAFVDECMSKLETDFEGDFEAFDEEMRSWGREPHGINWGDSPTTEQRMYDWCWELCNRVGLHGDNDMPAAATPGETFDWEDRTLMMVFEALSDDDT